MAADAVERLEMAFRVDALGLGRRPEQPRDVRKTVLLGLGGKRAVLLIGLAFTGECVLQIVVGIHEVLRCGGG